MSPGEELRAVSKVNEIVLALQIAPMLVEERRRRGRGRPPKYRRWELFALCIVKELLGLSFDKVAKLALFLIGKSPDDNTVWRAYRRWGREAGRAARIIADLVSRAERPKLLAVDSTGIRTYDGRSFKAHFLVNLETDAVEAAVVTEPRTSDAKGLRILLSSLRSGLYLFHNVCPFMLDHRLGCSLWAGLGASCSRGR